MLSFGHAVYTGLATFLAVHAMNAIAGGSLPVPMMLVPLLGGIGGMLFAVVLGFVTTKKAGTPFAMITLGIGELVFAMSLMVPEFFGGEAGISANRMVREPSIPGLTFGPAIHVYYLIAIYTLIATAGMYAFTRTPLGRMLNAVRDNPERVEFIGYNTQRVRYIAFMIAGFFAGIAGGMYAMNFEISTAEVVGAHRSGAYLLFTFVGGATFFFGPIIGGILMVLATVLLSEFTQAWLLYLGLVFMVMVMFAPGGVASLLMINVRVASFGKFRRLIGSYVALALAGTVAFVGAAAMIEMMYHLQLNAAFGPEVKFLGLTLDASGVGSWASALAVLVVGLGLLEVARRRFRQKWSDVQTEIQQEIHRREAA